MTVQLQVFWGSIQKIKFSSVYNNSSRIPYHFSYFKFLGEKAGSGLQVSGDNEMHAIFVVCNVWNHTKDWHISIHHEAGILSLTSQVP